MSSIGGPNIVTDSLVLYLDAANPKSFISGSTIWNDLSGNNNNGTLVNSPNFSSNNQGSIVFNGTDNYITIPNPINQSNLLQEWTVSAWINITDKISQSLVSGINSGLFVCFSQGNNSLLSLNSGANDYYTYGGDLGNIGWVFATFRFKNTTGDRTIYKNLTNISTTGPNKTSTPSGIISTLTIGRLSSSNYMEGNLSNIMMYDRYITNEELAQNYNATKSRFGL